MAYNQVMISSVLGAVGGYVVGGTLESFLGKHREEELTTGAMNMAIQLSSTGVIMFFLVRQGLADTSTGVTFLSTGMLMSQPSLQLRLDAILQELQGQMAARKAD